MWALYQTKQYIYFCQRFMSYHDISKYQGERKYPLPNVADTHACAVGLSNEFVYIMTITDRPNIFLMMRPLFNELDAPL